MLQIFFMRRTLSFTGSYWSLSPDMKNGKADAKLEVALNAPVTPEKISTEIRSTPKPENFNMTVVSATLCFRH